MGLDATARRGKNDCQLSEYHCKVWNKFCFQPFLIIMQIRVSLVVPAFRTRLENQYYFRYEAFFLAGLPFRYRGKLPTSRILSPGTVFRVR
jgi:hypothetical protein